MVSGGSEELQRWCPGGKQGAGVMVSGGANKELQRWCPGGSEELERWCPGGSEELECSRYFCG